MITETVSAKNIVRPYSSMTKRFSRFWTMLLREEEAATAVEYALLIALILVFCISAILSTGDVQKALWFDTADSISIIAQ